MHYWHNAHWEGMPMTSRIAKLRGVRHRIGVFSRNLIESQRNWPFSSRNVS
jgi:hypothetical protein